MPNSMLAPPCLQATTSEVTFDMGKPHLVRQATTPAELAGRSPRFSGEPFEDARVGHAGAPASGGPVMAGSVPRSHAGDGSRRKRVPLFRRYAGVRRAPH